MVNMFFSMPFISQVCLHRYLIIRLPITWVCNSGPLLSDTKLTKYIIQLVLIGDLARDFAEVV